MQIAASPDDRFSPPSLPQSVETYAWTSRVRRSPGTRRRIFLAVLATFGCALMLFHQMFIALAASALLLASVAEFLLPFRYVLDLRGARVICGPFTWLEMPWDAVKNVYLMRGGVKISPFRIPSAPLEPLRGILLRCDADVIPRVLAVVEALRLQGEARTAP